ncbi:flagellar protein FliO/FliZ [Propionivibrio dicarboxylicus]|uniref:Flagellar protein n=2 Tax=Propionivibrio dicarboxylicus TaxID=83767 RepID=A0A1G8HDI3_9RHOO|nr:flagellar protein FliO/FliZ [Propionivibrio dicarboxylicus]
MLTLQMLLGLGLIIGMLFLGAYLLQRLNGGKTFGHSGPMKVIGGLMLSPKERILLIEINDTWLIVGIVPGQIKTLHTLAKGELPGLEVNDNPFGQWLKQFATRHHEPK